MKSAAGVHAALPAAGRNFLSLGLVGAYANAVAYGFHYGAGNQEFELPFANWLSNPSLYPLDPIRSRFEFLPTLYWPALAYLSRWTGLERAVFLSFLLTKAVFFLAVARLTTLAVKNRALAYCIVLAVALSPFLNDFTPFGASDVLDNIQTNTSITIAALLWVGVYLVEERWWPAAILFGLSAYLNALLTVHSLCAFAVFAVRDWRERRGTIVTSALAGTAIVLPWLAAARQTLPLASPPGYVQALLSFLPLHLTLASHSRYDLLCGTGVLVAVAWMVRAAASSRLRRQPRLELLCGAYLFPVLAGALAGKFFLTPTLARAQLLRADTFLVLYAVLLIQFYGAKFLADPETPRRASALLLGLFAIVLPLSTRLELLAPLMAALLLWSDPHGAFEFLCHRLWRGRLDRLQAARRIRFVTIACICGFAVAAWLLLPAASRLWNFQEAPTPLEHDWYAVQDWARGHTPLDAQFLVPTYPCGFRAFSERGSWGEWRDGTLMYLDPSFAPIYRQRIDALGLSEHAGWSSYDAMANNYRRQSWEQLAALARANHLAFIVQFRDAAYPAAAVYSNATFAVYPAPK